MSLNLKNYRNKSALFATVLIAFCFAGPHASAKKKTKLAPAPEPTATPTPTPTQTPGPAPAGEKPMLEQLLKPKSITKVLEDYDIITNSQWNDDDFAFVNAILIRTPISFAWPKVVDWSLYPQMSSAIKKFVYDDRTQTIEMIGETHGLRMHSWIKVDKRYTDVVRFKIIGGDMTGFVINAYLWDKEGKTLAVAKGELPGAKQMLPTLVALVFKPVSEIVLGVATRNFRSYIEEDYKKNKR